MQVFKLQLILLIMVLKSQKVAITHLATGIDTQVIYHVVAIEKIASEMPVPHSLGKYFSTP